MNKIKYYMGIKFLLFFLVIEVFSILNYQSEGISIFNISAFLFGTIGTLVAILIYFVPYIVYDHSGYIQFPFFEKFKKEKRYSWEDVQEVFSIGMSHWTQVVTKDGNTWFITSLSKNNYYDTLRDLLKYISEEKFDKLTLKRAKGRKRFYFV